MIKYILCLVLFIFASSTSAAVKCDYQNENIKNGLLGLSSVKSVSSGDFIVTPFDETPFKYIVLFKDDVLAVVEQKHCVITNLTISLYLAEGVESVPQLNRLAQIAAVMPSIKRFVIADDFSKLLIGSKNIKMQKLNGAESFIVNLTNEIPVRDINSSIYFEYNTSDNMFGLYQKTLTLYASFGGHH